MRIETVNGRRLICGHIFPAYDVKVGQRWAPADGEDREVEIERVTEDYVYYRDNTGLRSKDPFGFQCRYCKISDE
jgi:hypothetical protein